MGYIYKIMNFFNFTALRQLKWCVYFVDNQFIDAFWSVEL